MSRSTAAARGSSPLHGAALALAGELGVPTYKTWAKGEHLLIGDGRTRRYKGLIPNISPLAVVTIALAQSRINRMAKRVPVEAPWTARERRWDAETIGGWLDGRGSRQRSVVTCSRWRCAGCSRRPRRRVAAAPAVPRARARRHRQAVLDRGRRAGEHGRRRAGGLAGRMAAELGDALRLNAPVRRSCRTTTACVVTRGRCRGRRPGTSSWSIAAGAHLSTSTGIPCCRSNGASSIAAAVAGSRRRRCWSTTSRSGGPTGCRGQTRNRARPRKSPSMLRRRRHARECSRRSRSARSQHAPTNSPAERREAVTTALAARFGPRAARLLAFVETAWWQEPWSRGCSLAHLPPGMLSRHGHLLRTPLGRVHWAGTETATVSHGAVDGAILSGQRAAREVLEVLA